MCCVGVHWQAVLRERFGLPSTVYYYFSKWVKAGVFKRLWAEALTFMTTWWGWSGLGKALMGP
jgi:transposase